jgi:hypothetical protein
MFDLIKNAKAHVNRAHSFRPTSKTTDSSASSAQGYAEWRFMFCSLMLLRCFCLQNTKTKLKN